MVTARSAGGALGNFGIRHGFRPVKQGLNHLLITGRQSRNSLA
jgi:hypothetical protein